MLNVAECWWTIQVVTKLVLLQNRQLLDSSLNFTCEGTVLSTEKLQLV